MTINELNEEYNKMCSKQECANCKYNNKFPCQLPFGYDKGRTDVLTELFCLAKEFAYDDGVDYSISLQDLDNIITELKGYK